MAEPPLGHSKRFSSGDIWKFGGDSGRFSGRNTFRAEPVRNHCGFRFLSQLALF